MKQQKEERAILKSGNKSFLKLHTAVLNSFTREKAALIELSHPSIIKLYKTYQDTDTIYILEELAEGVSINTLLKTYKTLPNDLIKYIALQIVNVLDYMHSLNYAHRDIKASHVFVDEKLKIKLIDFGFAKKIESKSNSFCGTYHAMAPEILGIPNKASTGYTKSVDLYAFGILLYEMKLGAPPSGYLINTSTPKDWALAYENARKGWDLVGVEGDMKDLLRGLLEADQDKRMTLEEMKAHKYFEGVDWNNIDATSISGLDEFTSYIELVGTRKLIPINEEDDPFAIF